jgi:hypothetical protein
MFISLRNSLSENAVTRAQTSLGLDSFHPRDTDHPARQSTGRPAPAQASRLAQLRFHFTGDIKFAKNEPPLPPRHHDPFPHGHIRFVRAGDRIRAWSRLMTE